MLMVESADPCYGPSGTYELWMHQLRVRRQASLVRLALLGRPRTVERELDLPHLPDPWAMVHMAERSLERQPKRLSAVTSLVRYCDRVSHADGARTDPDTKRLEVGPRIVWVPHYAVRLPVITSSADLDNEGIGKVAAVNRAFDGLHPLVAAPVTKGERRVFASQSESQAITALPSLMPANIVWALLHTDTEGNAIERIHTEDVDRLG